MASLKGAAQRVQDCADNLGLEITVKEMAASTRTAEEAAAACACALGQIVKSLVFCGRDTGRPFLLLVSGTNRVNERRAAIYTGEKLTRPDAAYVRDITGFAIGGIPPFAHTRPLATYIDRDLLAFDRVWAAAGTPNCLFSVSPQALAEAVEATIVDVA